MLRMTQLIGLLSVLHVVNGDVFASVVDLVDVLKSEQKVIQSLKNYVEDEANRLAEITELIQTMEITNEKALEDPEGNLSNIISGFQTIARFTVEWDKQKESILSLENHESLIQDFDKLTAGYPSKMDLKRASDSIFRLQSVYDLIPEQFTNGSLAKNAMTMTAKDCFQVAEVAFEQFDLYHATMWFEQARTLSKAGDKSIERGKIYEFMLFAYFKGNIPENLGHIVTLCEEWEQYDPNSELAKINLRMYSTKLESLIYSRTYNCDGNKSCEKEITDSLLLDKPVFQRIKKDWEKDAEYMRFETLCRGEDVYSSSDVTCSYRRYNPLHVLKPLKEEVFLKDPFIAVYHDFISDSEISVLQDLAKEKLHRSIIFGTEDKEDKETHIRTSKTAWIADHLHPVVERITKKSVTIGNLSDTSCDEMQVVCYGLGGHYAPHFDWLKDDKFKPELGDRIATIVHYLSDFVGGSTAFINVGVKIPPKKGATLFWWNLHRNLTGDIRNLHAGCPVIYGNKWIANKWVHRMGQTFHRPCSTDPMA